MTRPRRGGGDDAHDGQDGDCGGDGFGYGGRAFVECFFGGEGGGGFGGGGCRGFSFAFASFDLCGDVKIGLVRMFVSVGLIEFSREDRTDAD